MSHRTANKRVRFVNCNVLDVYRGILLNNTSVTIEAGMIADVGSTVSHRGHITIDLCGFTVMPGLADAHVHVCMGGTANALDLYLNEAAGAKGIRSISNLCKCLQRGVTMIRDAGSPTDAVLRLRSLQAGNMLVGPRIFTSGAVVTTQGGHCYYFGMQVGTVSEADKAVHDLVEAGADFIKVMGSGGSLTKGTNPNSCQFDDEQMRVLVSTAHRLGKKVSVHAHSEQAIEQAIDAGADSIEHGSYATEHQLDRIHQQGICLVPTLAPAFRALKAPGVELSEDLRCRVEQRLAATKLAIQKGVRILAGTDAGIPNMPHGNVSEEVILLAQLGLSPAEAIRAATVNVCHWLGVSNKLGAVEEGMIADLIVVPGDPLQNLEVISEPAMVVQSGTVVYAESHRLGEVKHVF